MFAHQLPPKNLSPRDVRLSPGPLSAGLFGTHEHFANKVLNLGLRLSEHWAGGLDRASADALVDRLRSLADEAAPWVEELEDIKDGLATYRNNLLFRLNECAIASHNDSRRILDCIGEVIFRLNASDRRASYLAAEEERKQSDDMPGGGAWHRFYGDVGVGAKEKAGQALLTAARIRQGGDDISQHYLAGTTYQVFRYMDKVYALRDDQFVHMWDSHSQREKFMIDKGRRTLGEGAYGIVHKKTDSKAVKVLKWSPNMQSGKSLQRMNEKLLEAKFKLVELGIDAYFGAGLWNTKEAGKPRYIMPFVRAKRGTVSQADTIFDPRQTDAFIVALRKFNQAGYCHPDLSAHVGHRSGQNIIQTDDRLVAIDMDSDPTGQVFCGPRFPHKCPQDQWLFFCNWGNQSLKDYYGTKNTGPVVPLSTNVSKLRKLYSDPANEIYIPPQILDELDIEPRAQDEL
jgi:hypothetical protein